MPYGSEFHGSLIMLLASDQTCDLSFLRAELSWNQSKVDDLLLPIIQKQGKRSQVRANRLLIRHIA